MTLRALVVRRTRDSITFAYPPGRRPYMWEQVLTRNIGHRPYGEMTYVAGGGFQPLAGRDLTGWIIETHWNPARTVR